MKPASFQDNSRQFWELIKSKCFAVPNFWDYLGYDDFLYDLMAQDHVRNKAYREVLAQKVRGKTVVEIGPGDRLVLTLMAAEAGAAKIYAIEVDEEAYQKAQALVIEKGLANQIELIHGLSDEVELPEKVDVCLSEIIGTIGNSEGATRHLRDAKRFLKPSGIMIPEGILTWLSPISKPDRYQDDFLSELISFYSKLVEEKLDHAPDFPMYECWNIPSSNFISPPQLFEEYWFNEAALEDVFSKTLTFHATQNTRFDGLLLWINLYVGAEHVLGPYKNTTHWPSVYIPITPCELKAGDVIDVHCRSDFISSAFTPDYTFDVLINGSKITSKKISF